MRPVLNPDNLLGELVAGPCPLHGRRPPVLAECTLQLCGCVAGGGEEVIKPVAPRCKLLSCVAPGLLPSLVQPPASKGKTLVVGAQNLSCAPAWFGFPCPAGGWLGSGSILTPNPGNLPRSAPASLPWGCPPSARVVASRRWAPRSATAPGAAITLPHCVGTAPRVGACRISLFKWGSWHPAKLLFVLSNILANCVSASA